MQVLTRDIQKAFTGLRVIVVDDVIDCRDVVELYLKQMEAEVLAVGSADDALSIVGRFQPELIISDIYMPERDGYWLIKQFNRLNIKIPKIALTVAAKDVDRDRLLAAGYDGYISKPFIFEDLNRLITKLTTN